METIIERAREIRAAIKRGAVDAALLIIDSDEGLLSHMTPFGTWLHVAADAGELRLARELIARGLDINSKRPPMNTNAIDIAASAGRKEMVEYLLSNGCEMDTSKPDRNPLFGAIYGGHLDIAKILVDYGINLQIKYTVGTMKNFSAIEFAEEQGQIEIADFLRTKLAERERP